MKLQRWIKGSFQNFYASMTKLEIFSGEKLEFVGEKNELMMSVTQGSHSSFYNSQHGK
jgi:hypothetical protein